ncbi:hypothetical protein FACS189464_4000 [Bacteroidia bacterium]|nr:hypothetical protein FACS189464_4000 [Bacteroidia bacterium]
MGKLFIGLTGYLNMKKVFFSLLLASVGIVGYSQDIIVTKDSKRIEAKVTEVNVDNIRYFKFDNLEGPVYTLPKSELTVILFQNGQVENFDTSAKQQPSQSSQSSQQVWANPDEQKFSKWINSNGKEFSEWNDGEVVMFFKENHPDLFKSFYRGHRRIHGGRFLAIVGGLATLAGGGLLIYDGLQDDIPKEPDIRVAGTASLVAGQVLLGGGIAIIITGSNQKRKAKNAYMQRYGYINTDYNQSFQSCLKLNVYGNGVGLAYVFH